VSASFWAEVDRRESLLISVPCTVGRECDLDFICAAHRAAFGDEPDEPDDDEDNEEPAYCFEHCGHPECDAERKALGESTYCSPRRGQSYEDSMCRWCADRYRDYCYEQAEAFHDDKGQWGRP
jgi:hypothetical protein